MSNRTPLGQHVGIGFAHQVAFRRSLVWHARARINPVCFSDISIHQWLVDEERLQPGIGYVGRQGIPSRSGTDDDDVEGFHDRISEMRVCNILDMV